VERLILDLGHLIRSALGAGPARLFAPAYSEASTEPVRPATAMGYRAILWKVDPMDWKRPAAQVIVKRADRAGAGAPGAHAPQGRAPAWEGLLEAPARPSARGLCAAAVTGVLGPALCQGEGAGWRPPTMAMTSATPASTGSNQYSPTHAAGRHGRNLLKKVRALETVSTSAVPWVL